jgi:virginiamycin A acetyltransferase
VKESCGEPFEDQVFYHYEVIGTKLIIGKFCSIAPEVRFLMDGGNHRMDGSTFPFSIFGHGWEKRNASIKMICWKVGLEWELCMENWS